MGRKWSLVFGLGLMAVGGCEVLSQALALLSQIDLLGVVPAQGFANPSSADYGKVKFAIGGRDDLGVALAPVANELEVVPDDGQDVEQTDSTTVEGHDAGSFLFLVDGSGSTEADPTCTGCPTDPDRLRVEATKAVAEELGTCHGAWRMSLMEFGGYPSSGYAVTDVLADWTNDPTAIETAADGLGSYATTPLWDSVYETLDALAADAPSGATTFDSGVDTTDWGRGIVVVSDGADNASVRTLDQVVAHALELGIAVHTIGFGPASDSVDSPDDLAVDGLRQLADQTGGTYGFVSTVDDLPALTTAIGGAMCGGYTELDTTFSDPAPSGDTVTGQLRVKSAPSIAVPFTFRAP